MLQLKVNNTASITTSTSELSNINIINNESIINTTDDESDCCIKANDNEIILVTVNNADVIKGKYKGETGKIIKVIRKKIALNV